MKANRRRDTGPERLLRSELHRRGMRFRVDYPVLPRRRSDVAFPSRRVAVFVAGCFWHGCPIHGTMAKANAAFWAEKLRSNRSRDRDTDARLSAAGWQVIRAWEHQPFESVADLIEEVIRSRQPGA